MVRCIDWGHFPPEGRGGEVIAEKLSGPGGRRARREGRESPDAVAAVRGVELLSMSFPLERRGVASSSGEWTARRFLPLVVDVAADFA